jgi:hypothetical protein
MTTKKRTAEDELAGFKQFPHTTRTKQSGNSGLPRVTVIGGGKAVVIYPDDETVAALKSEHWDTVKVQYRHDENGELEELAIITSEDNVGVGIRYYEKQRVSIHVTVEKTLGMAVAKPNATACLVRRVGDAFVFNVRDHIGIKPRTISNA